MSAKNLVSLIVFLMLFFMVSLASADTVTLKWDNPTTYENGATITTADQAVLQTVVEYKKSTATTWVELATTLNGLNTYKWTVTDAFVRGETIDFRAKSRLVKNGLNYDGVTYSNTASWIYPFVRPGTPTNFTVTLTAAISSTVVQ